RRGFAFSLHLEGSRYLLKPVARLFKAANVSWCNIHSRLESGFESSSLGPSECRTTPARDRPHMLLLISTACAGVFCGAALYVNVVEHPARMSCGQELAVREFAPSYRRATIMQVPLAIGGLVLGLAAAWQLRDAGIAAGAILLGASVPFTLIAILP